MAQDPTRPEGANGGPAPEVKKQQKPADKTVKVGSSKPSGKKK